MTWLRRCAATVVLSCVPVAATRAASFPVGHQPRGMAFDGQNIWVANHDSSTLTKLRANDGAALGTFPAQAPHEVTFDGATIWWSRVADFPFVGGCVGRTRASDGAFLGCVTLPQISWGLAFDGTHVWAAVENGTVAKIRASDGAIVGTFAVGADPMGVLFDGANVWVSAQGSHLVKKFRASDGLVLGTFDAGSTPE